MQIRLEISLQSKEKSNYSIALSTFYNIMHFSGNSIKLYIIPLAHWAG